MKRHIRIYDEIPEASFEPKLTEVKSKVREMNKEEWFYNLSVENKIAVIENSRVNEVQNDS